MASYLFRTPMTKGFKVYKVEQIPRGLNCNVDTLARLASFQESKLRGLISVEFLAELSIARLETILEINHEPRSRYHIIMFLK